MKTRNFIGVHVDSIYDNKKTIEKPNGESVEIYTDAIDGNDLLVGDRHLKEYTKKNTGVVKHEYVFSQRERSPFRAIGIKHPVKNSYLQENYTMPNIGDTIMFEHSVTFKDNVIELDGDILYKCMPQQLQAIVRPDGDITPCNGFILLEKIDKETSDIIDTSYGKNHWELKNGSIGKLYKVDPKCGKTERRVTDMLLDNVGQYVAFNNKVAQDLIHNGVEYYLVRATDLLVILNSEDDKS